MLSVVCVWENKIKYICGLHFYHQLSVILSKHLVHFYWMSSVKLSAECSMKGIRNTDSHTAHETDNFLRLLIRCIAFKRAAHWTQIDYRCYYLVSNISGNCSGLVRWYAMHIQNIRIMRAPHTTSESAANVLQNIYLHRFFRFDDNCPMILLYSFVYFSRFQVRDADGYYYANARCTFDSSH